ncbi:hypothetical protein [Actinomadura kijaniata]|uniref:hypothetical protein n=1 Tax=Actinomadura kijaniata TaxID=46161 RepID=UPI00350E3CFC
MCPGVIEPPMLADTLEGQAEAMAEIMEQQPGRRLRPRSSDGRPEAVRPYRIHRTRKVSPRTRQVSLRRHTAAGDIRIFRVHRSPTR